MSLAAARLCVQWLHARAGGAGPLYEPVPDPRLAVCNSQAKLMRRCIELAQEAVAKGGAPYGALM